MLTSPNIIWGPTVCKEPVLGIENKREIKCHPAGEKRSTSAPITVVTWPHTIVDQFSHSAVSDSLWPHGLQHARLPCPSSIPRVYSNSCPLSQWCHPTIPSSVIPFSSCLQSFPASGSFQRSQLFASGGQRSFSFSMSPSNEHPGLISFRMDWLDLLTVQGLEKCKFKPQ